MENFVKEIKSKCKIFLQRMPVYLLTPNQYFFSMIHVSSYWSIDKLSTYKLTIRINYMRYLDMHEFLYLKSREFHLRSVSVRAPSVSPSR